MQLPVYTDMPGNIPWREVPAFRLIDCQLGQVRELINQQLTTAAKAGDIKPLLDYIGSRAGKMIRPGLVLLSYRAIRDASCEKKMQYDILDMQDEVIRVAAIVEMTHNATLLHDDVIDEGQKRRGLPTVNSLWGNESAVLLGDLLLSQVFKMCVDLQPKINNVIAAIAARTCEGELRQISLRKQGWQLSEAEYIEIIAEKSAAFFSGCCRLGGLLAEATETQIQSLARFGLNAGIAFQITDDLLDVAGDESRMGKTAGSDVGKNKLTLAVIHLLRTVDEAERWKLYNMLDAAAEGKDAIAGMLKSYSSLEYAHSQSQEFVAKAVKALSNLTESEARDALIETAKFMASREV